MHSCRLCANFFRENQLEFSHYASLLTDSRQLSFGPSWYESMRVDENSHASQLSFSFGPGVYLHWGRHRQQSRQVEYGYHSSTCWPVTWRLEWPIITCMYDLTIFVWSSYFLLTAQMVESQHFRKRRRWIIWGTLVRSIANTFLLVHFISSLFIFTRHLL